MTLPAAALPALPPGPAPAGARTATPAERDALRTALGFERVLLAQLTETLAEGAGLTGDGAAGAAQAGHLPTALADALMAGGGLGLAAQLQPALLEARR